MERKNLTQNTVICYKITKQFLQWQRSMNYRTKMVKSAIYDEIRTIRWNFGKIGPADPEFSLPKSLFWKNKKKLLQAEHNSPHTARAK